MNTAIVIPSLDPDERLPAYCRALRAATDAPEALPYKKGGSIRVKKEDFTSYREGVPYYTVIVRDTPRPLKLLLDLTPEALRLIRRWNRDAFPAADRPA